MAAPVSRCCSLFVWLYSYATLLADRPWPEILFPVPFRPSFLGVFTSGVPIFLFLCSPRPSLLSLRARCGLLLLSLVCFAFSNSSFSSGMMLLLSIFPLLASSARPDFAAHPFFSFLLCRPSFIASPLCCICFGPRHHCFHLFFFAWDHLTSFSLSFPSFLAVVVPLRFGPPLSPIASLNRLALFSASLLSLAAILRSAAPLLFWAFLFTVWLEASGWSPPVVFSSPRAAFPASLLCSAGRDVVSSCGNSLPLPG